MFADQIFDLRFGPGVERVISGAHVGEFGAAAFVDGDPAGQDGILRRDRPERTVGVPELIAQIEHAAAIVARQRFVVGVQIGHVGHERAETLVLGLGDVAAVGVSPERRNSG